MINVLLLILCFLISSGAYASLREDNPDILRTYTYKPELEGTKEFSAYRQIYFLPQHRDYFNAHNNTSYHIDEINNFIWKNNNPTLEQVVNKINELTKLDHSRPSVHSHLVKLSTHFYSFLTIAMTPSKEQEEYDRIFIETHFLPEIKKLTGNHPNYLNYDNFVHGQGTGYRPGMNLNEYWQKYWAHKTQVSPPLYDFNRFLSVAMALHVEQEEIRRELDNLPQKKISRGIDFVKETYLHSPSIVMSVVRTGVSAGIGLSRVVFYVPIMCFYKIPILCFYKIPKGIYNSLFGY